MLTLTDKARDTIARFISSTDKPLTGLKIAVNSGGCSGLQYAMGLVEAAGEDDLTIDCGPVKVYVAPDSAVILQGTVIDYVESLEGSGFTFDNPNASQKCSCGKSFAA
ncbi:MAG: iron-sulfur cluster assembly accessory protein [Hyphomicrobiales bacterium]